MKFFNAKFVFMLAGLLMATTPLVAQTEPLEFEAGNFRITTTSGRTLAGILVKNCDKCPAIRLLVTESTRIRHFSLGEIKVGELRLYQDSPVYLKADPRSKHLELVSIGDKGDR